MMHTLAVGFYNYCTHVFTTSSEDAVSFSKPGDLMWIGFCQAEAFGQDAEAFGQDGATGHLAC